MSPTRCPRRESEHSAVWETCIRKSLWSLVSEASTTSFQMLLKAVRCTEPFPKAKLWWGDKMLIEQQHPLISSIGFSGILAKMREFGNEKIIIQQHGSPRFVKRTAQQLFTKTTGIIWVLSRKIKGHKLNWLSSHICSQTGKVVMVRRFFLGSRLFEALEETLLTELNEWKGVSMRGTALSNKCTEAAKFLF